MKVRVASAGTGKTTSLVQRYLELLSEGIPLRRIAGVTFTRAAADELRQRVAAGINEVYAEGKYLGTKIDIDKALLLSSKRELDGVVLSTIHGFMLEGLRLCAPHMGLDPQFSVIGPWQAEAFFEEELKSLIYLAEDKEHDLHEAIAGFGARLEPLVLKLFNNRSLCDDFQSNDPKSQALINIYARAYDRYRVRLGATLLPPSEIERRALAMVNHKMCIERLAQRFKVVLVDEYQDVNPMQGRFFATLEETGIRVEIVGDPKQSIYGFRNADVDVFREARKKGEELEPLITTRRHASYITRFLNKMTGSFAEQDLGFSVDEAPDVKRPEDEGEDSYYNRNIGRVEIHWILATPDNEPIADLRRYEAKILAGQIKQLVDSPDNNYHSGDVAVLARSYAGLQLMEEALASIGLDYVLLQGRGYFERLEVRDLYHALRVGIDPSGLSLAAFLRSPFGQLSFDDLDKVLDAPLPLELLEKHHEDVYTRIELIQEKVRTTPLKAIKFIIRELDINGKRYVDYIDARARENVDQLLFTVAEQPPGDIEILLERLELLSRQTDAGDVPQSGKGVKLLTVHRSKGLEWPVVAVYDLGRSNYMPPEELYIEKDSGLIALKDGKDFTRLKKILKERNDQEAYRLLYVAASRARDVLLLSGSVKKVNKLDGWVSAIDAMGLGPMTKEYNQEEFLLKHWDYDAKAVSDIEIPEQKKAALEESSWVDTHFPSHKFPPVYSPSKLKEKPEEEKESHDVSNEPVKLPDADEGEQLPGRGAAIGTLVHYAISQDWTPDDDLQMQNLQYQEVMFPFSTAKNGGKPEQEEILEEVKSLLANYYAMLGSKLETIEARDEDYPEVPMAMPHGDTVWQGIIDRLYRVGDTWYLEDYKTDRVMKPEIYHFQLAVYMKAIEEIKGIKPQAQLVYLRNSEVVRLDAEVLEDAFEAAVLM